jgi:hypothetical protein
LLLRSIAPLEREREREREGLTPEIVLISKVPSLN